MPIFGGTRRPPLEGLTRDEQKRRDALNPEVIERSKQRGVIDQAPAAAAILREKMTSEPADLLWPLLLGRQMMSMRRFGQAIEAFEAAVQRDGDDVRADFGAGLACYRAAEYKQTHGDAATADVAPPEMTVENLYQEALRHFRRAMELTPDKGERDELASAASTVTRAVARKRGRL
jgi:tetratricopeptide (TPR) repeat protein